MAVYDGERFIREQLDSFVRQTQLPDELVVSDNASTDRTVEIVREFATQAPFPVRLFINERNLGVTKNFERAITECTGDVIFLSDCDDVWYPKKIEIMSAALEDSAADALVLCNGELVDEHLHPQNLRTWDSRGFHANSALRASIEAGTAFVYWLPFLGSHMAFRASVRPKLLPLPSGEYYHRMGHDGFIAWVAVCSGIGGARLLDSPLLAYRQHVGQMTRHHLSKAEQRRAHRHAWKQRPVAMMQPILDRLDQLGEPADPVKTHLYRAVVGHLRTRCTLPARRFARLPKIARELLARRYNYYSPRGTLSAIRDLLFVQ